MEQDRPTALRGFDSYELRLGDELRGHRATLGKSLLDVQRELRIKASFIDGIENGDPSVVPNPGFVPGYVRAYARYLGLDPESVYRRFCEENGFVGQTSRMAQTGTSPKGGLALGAGALGASAGRDPSLSASHFASPVGRARPVGLGVAPSDIASALVLVALIGGLGWGGWALVKDIQRVEFAPVNETPELLAAAPAGGALPTLAPTAEPAPWIAAGPDRQAALEELYSPGFDDAPAPTTDFGDGPIAAIDPDTSGLFSRSAFSPPTREAAPRIAGSVPAAPSGPGLGQAAAPPRFAATPPTGGAPSAGAPAAPLPAGAPQPRPILSASTDPTQVAPLAAAPSPAASLAAGAAPGLFVVAQERAWMRVTAADGTVLMERILEEGETWQAPGRGAGLRLRTGNAGGTVVRLDGAVYGPIGTRGSVATADISADAVVASLDLIERAAAPTSAFATSPALATPPAYIPGAAAPAPAGRVAAASPTAAFGSGASVALSAAVTPDVPTGPTPPAGALAAQTAILPPPADVGPGLEAPATPATPTLPAAQIAAVAAPPPEAEAPGATSSPLPFVRPDAR